MGVNHRVTWGLAGYECFGPVVLPHGLSEIFDAPADPPPNKFGGIRVAGGRAIE